MLYNALKKLVRFVLKLYFRNIEEINLEALENNQPTILIANHTNAFLDGLFLGSIMNRKVCFFTRGDAFNNPKVAKILRSLGMLPIYRKQDTDQNNHALNDISNQEAIEVLKQNGCVLIFGEGVSETDKVLQPLKKGAYRLAVQAVPALGKLPAMFPVGINYISPMKAFTNASIVVGKQVEVGTVPDLNSLENQNQLYVDLLRDTQEKLEPCVLDCGTFEKAKSHHDFFIQNDHLDFRHAKAICNHIKADEPYTGEKKSQNRSLLVKLIGTIILIPTYIFFGIPYFISRHFAKKLADTEDFYASIFIALMIITTLIWLILLAISMPLFFGIKTGLLVLLIGCIYSYLALKINNVFCS